MSDKQRDQRLASELALLKKLQEESTLFSFEATGDPPTKYVVSFRGEGISRSMTSSDDVQKVSLHRCELRMPYAFPERPPDIRWLTPIHHPNISFSGLVKLRDVGLPWEEDLSLDIICERLWDMARLAYYDEDRAVNYAARNWLADQDEVRLPTDHRPLRDKAQPLSSNVVKYNRNEPARAAARKATGKARRDDVLYIGEETPAAPPRRRPPPSDNDDVLYIGYE